MKATKRLISSVWTLEYTITKDNKINILNYSRTDDEGYEKEETLPRLTIIEDKKRTVTGVYLSPYIPFQYEADISSGQFYEVENPQYIFSYEK